MKKSDQVPKKSLASQSRQTRKKIVKTSSLNRAIVIKNPFAVQILSGSKTWEMRGSRCQIRGQVGLIESGTGHIMGSINLYDCIGPLSKKELIENKNKHLCSSESIRKNVGYKKVYAWVIKNPIRFRKPVPYKHPPGAIIWVKLKA